MNAHEIFRNAKTIAVVGLSGSRTRVSYSVSEYMQSVGFRIIPVNPNEAEVLGEKSYATLYDVPEPFEIVSIFRRSEFVAEVVDAAIRMGARVIWMQEGVVDIEAAERGRAAGLTVVMDRCILKEYGRMRRAKTA